MENIKAPNFKNNDLLIQSKDYSKFCERTDVFSKKLEFLKGIIQTRGEVFSQKKEKYQHLLDFQINKIEKEKEEYIKKSEELSTKIHECKIQLESLNSNFAQLKVKHDKEKQLNLELNENIIKLQTDSKQNEEEFRSTSKNYETVISLYEEFLNLAIDLESENKIVYVYFKNSRNIQDPPYVAVKIVDTNNFEIVKCHPFINDTIFKKKMLNKHGLMLVLCSCNSMVNMW